MKSRAYSLIEILVVISIMAIIIQVGYANYRDFSRRQTVISYARSLESDLRMAQEFALSGKKPAFPAFNCPSPGNSLKGIRFNMNSDTSYQITAVCSNGNESQPIKRVDLPTGVSLSRPSDRDILFRTVGQGTDLANGISIGICAFNQGAVVSLSPSGDISQYLTGNCSRLGGDGYPPF